MARVDNLGISALKLGCGYGIGSALSNLTRRLRDHLRFNDESTVYDWQLYNIFAAFDSLAISRLDNTGFHLVWDQFKKLLGGAKDLVLGGAKIVKGISKKEEAWTDSYFDMAIQKMKSGLKAHGKIIKFSERRETCEISPEITVSNIVLATTTGNNAFKSLEDEYCQENKTGDENFGHQISKFSTKDGVIHPYKMKMALRTFHGNMDNVSPGNCGPSLGFQQKGTEKHIQLHVPKHVLDDHYATYGNEGPKAQAKARCHAIIETSLKFLQVDKELDISTEDGGISVTGGQSKCTLHFKDDTGELAASLEQFCSSSVSEDSFRSCISGDDEGDDERRTGQKSYTKTHHSGYPSHRIRFNGMPWIGYDSLDTFEVEDTFAEHSCKKPTRACNTSDEGSDLEELNVYQSISST